MLLLDIDGVLNPYGVADPPVGYADHDLFPGEEPVRVNPRHGVWLSEVRGVLDIAWASSRNDDANKLLVPLLNLPQLPAVPMPPRPFDASAKVTVNAAYAQHRPVAWIDDLHTPQAHRWAAGRPAPTLLITTDPIIALTRDSIDRVIAWARGPMSR